MRRVERAFADLEAGAGVGGSVRFERLAREDTQAWRDHDLASLMENRLAVDLDPRAIDDATRTTWTATATEDGRLYGPDREFAQPYWLVRDHERIGTISIARSTLGSARCGVSSLYVRSDRRGLGVAGSALEAVTRAVQRHGLSGIRLETSWCWSAALAFYLRRGFWVRSWKRDIALVACSSLPSYTVDVQGDLARFTAGPTEESAAIAIVAERRGDRLSWSTTDTSDRSEAAFQAPGTFAAILALRGWPLIRSDEAWAVQLAQGFSDCGGPEGLAFRIREWDAWSDHRGWRCSAPRIPGLDYPTWQDLEADWKRDEPSL